MPINKHTASVTATSTDERNHIMKALALSIAVLALTATGASAQLRIPHYSDPYSGQMRDMQQWQRDYEYQRQWQEQQDDLYERSRRDADRRMEEREYNAERRHRERLDELRRQRDDSDED
jgi:hypothetical protein